MMKRGDVLFLVCVGMMVAGLIWLGILAYGASTYKYAHPELTQTQLEIIFLSRLRWPDLIPIGCVFLGAVLMGRGTRK